MEGAWCWRHQDPLPPDQTLLPYPDEAGAGAEGLCKPHHLPGHGAQTHEHFSQRTGVDRH